MASATAKKTSSAGWTTPPYSFISAENLRDLMKAPDRTALDLLVIDVRVRLFLLLLLFADSFVYSVQA